MKLFGKRIPVTKVALAVLTLVLGILIFSYAQSNVAANPVVPATAGGKDTWLNILIWLTPVAAITALIYVFFAARHVRKKDEGSDKVKKLSAAIRVGAMAYLKQQYKVVGIFFGIMFIALVAIAYGSGGKVLSHFVPYAFITGGFFSGLAGFIGMRIATQANSRTAWAARDGLNPALRVAFMAGSVMGMAVVGLGLLDLSAWFIGLKYIAKIDDTTITQIMLTFEMGASSMALFARVGGGIYTKSADVGADIVGKVEAGIPEDDPRNPATIADNVGDNVGDVAGMGADLYESYVGSIVATMALGAVAFPANPLKAIIVPMAIASLGVFASLIGSFLVSTKDDKASQKVLLGALRRGVYSATLLILGLAAVVVFNALGKENMGVFWALAVGLIAGNVIGFFTEYYTSDNYKPTQKLAGQAETGAATLIIGGLALGMKSTWVSVATIIVATIASYGLAAGTLGVDGFALGVYGIGIAAVGMLSTLGITLSTDAYGPVADNAGGIAEMAGTEGGLGDDVRKRTDALDSLGNTTAATGKGFAIGSAALTALALLAAFKQEITEAVSKLGSNLDISAQVVTPEVLVGLFIGAMTPFLFSAMTMSAVGRAAQAMVEEVRRQFREIKGILTGQAEPDYQKCVAISTKGAQKEMVAPALLAIVMPLAVGSFLGLNALLGLLAGALVTGFPFAIMMANSGGSWDNAKKYIEAGNMGGKGSAPHKAAVVGDTVGDPFKDTSGPSLNILIKLMSMVSVVFGVAMYHLNKVVGLFK